MTMSEQASLRMGEFTCKRSDDPVKTDLELVCTKCDALVCDIEDGDDLSVLVSVATEHDC